MVDNMKLMLDKNMFLVNNLSLFQKERQNATRGYFTLVQNSTKSELLSGIYKPKLTLTKRFNFSGRFEPTLSIEASLPKLVYKNNFDELTDADFKYVAETLQKRLKEMGISVFWEVLINAPVSSVHFSKNLPLTDGTTPYHYIKKISEGNYKLSVHTDKANYRDDGQLFKLHVNSWELAFYDKLKELDLTKKNDKGSIENDNAIQLGLFNNLTMSKPFEVFRMEARLNKRSKIKNILSAVGRNEEITFKSLFSSKLSQAVLLHFLDYIEKARPKLLDYKPREPKALLPDIIINNPDFSPRKQVMLYGLKQTMDMYGMRELRSMFGKQKNREWYRLVNESKKIKLPKTQDVFQTLRKHLMLFESLKLVDFQAKMINNDKDD